jgi:hypothetical protein
MVQQRKLVAIDSFDGSEMLREVAGGVVSERYVYAHFASPLTNGDAALMQWWWIQIS